MKPGWIILKEKPTIHKQVIPYLNEGNKNHNLTKIHFQTYHDLTKANLQTYHDLTKTNFQTYHYVSWWGKLFTPDEAKQ